MPKQTITIGPDGSISGLQVKPGRGVVLSEVDAASVKVERATLVEWDEEKRGWYINILESQTAVRKWMNGFLDRLNDDMGRAYHITPAIFCTAIGEYDEEDEHASSTNIMYWRNYDDAVKFEIEFLDALRKQGIY